MVPGTPDWGNLSVAITNLIDTQVQLAQHLDPSLRSIRKIPHIFALLRNLGAGFSLAATSLGFTEEARSLKLVARELGATARMPKVQTDAYLESMGGDFFTPFQAVDRLRDLLKHFQEKAQEQSYPKAKSTLAYCLGGFRMILRSFPGMGPLVRYVERAMDSVAMAERVAHKYAGALLQFPGSTGQKFRNPTITISSVKYTLSTHGGPLGDLAEPEDPSWAGSAKVIRMQSDNPWKFLWVYDTDRQMVAMWRVTDGNNKVWGPAQSEAMSVVKLDRKGQINRVTHDIFVKIESAMHKLERVYMAELERYIAESKTDFQHQVDALVQEYYETVVEPRIIKEVGDVNKGAIPFGFKPNPDSSFPQDRQRINFVMSRIYDTLFTSQKIHVFLKAHGVDMDNPQGDIQAAYWAQNEIWENAMDKYYPSLR